MRKGPEHGVEGLLYKINDRRGYEGEKHMLLIEGTLGGGIEFLAQRDFTDGKEGVSIKRGGEEKRASELDSLNKQTPRVDGPR